MNEQSINDLNSRLAAFGLVAIPESTEKERTTSHNPATSTRTTTTTGKEEEEEKRILQEIETSGGDSGGIHSGGGGSGSSGSKINGQKNVLASGSIGTEVPESSNSESNRSGEAEGATGVDNTGGVDEQPRKRKRKRKKKIKLKRKRKKRQRSSDSDFDLPTQLDLGWLDLSFG